MTILKNTHGFTLIEALIAMTVLSVGILALSTMQINSTKGNSTANTLTVAGTVAGNSYERLLNVQYNDPTMDPAGNPHDGTELGGLQLPTSVNSISWNVTEWTNDNIDHDGDGDNSIVEDDELDIKVVTLTVNYTNRLAKALTITFYKSEIF